MTTGRRAGAALRALAAAARAAATLALLLAACSRAPSPRDQPEHRRPPDNRAGTVALDAAPPPPDADAACVDACVQSRQMEATSIDYIRQSCTRQCALPAPPARP